MYADSPKGKEVAELSDLYLNSPTGDSSSPIEISGGIPTGDTIDSLPFKQTTYLSCDHLFSFQHSSSSLFSSVSAAVRIRRVHLRLFCRDREKRFSIQSTSIRFFRTPAGGAAAISATRTRRDFRSTHGIVWLKDPISAEWSFHTAEHAATCSSTSTPILRSDLW